MFQFSWFPLAEARSWVLPKKVSPIRVPSVRLARQLTEAYRSHAAPVFGC